MAVVLFQGYRQALFANSQEYNNIILSQVCDTIDTTIREINTLSLNISMNNKVIKLAWTPTLTPRENINEAVDIIQVLKNYKKDYQYIDSIQIYYKNSDMVITDQSRFHSARDFVSYGSTAYWSEKELKTLYSGNSIQRLGTKVVDRKTGEDKIYTVIYPLVIASPNQFYGYATINFDYSYLEGFVKHIGAENSIIAVDESGKPMLAFGNQEYVDMLPDILESKVSDLHYFKQGKDNFVVINQPSETSPWTYYLILEENAYLKNMRSMLIVYLAISVFAFGLALSIWLAWRNFSPIQEIMVDINQMTSSSALSPEKHANELTTIHSMTKQALQEYNSLTLRMTRQIPVMQESIIRSYLLGTVKEEGKSAESKEYAGISFPWRNFVVILFHIKNLKAEHGGVEMMNARLKLLVEEAFFQQYQEKQAIYFADMTRQQTALVLNSSLLLEQQRDPLRELLMQIQRELEGNFPITLTIAIGSLAHHPLDLRESYIAAEQALDHRLFEIPGGIIYSDEMEASVSRYYYPIELENQLIQNVKEGNLEEVHTIIDEIILKNYVYNKISLEASKHLQFNLLGTALRVYNDLSLTMTPSSLEASLFTELPSSVNAQQVEVSIRELFTEICSHINQVKEKNASVVQTVLEHIARHYQDSSLSLQSVAEVANLNSSYFSTYFKEQVGENFNVYVNRLRLEKGCELLKTTDYTLDVIAEKIGYTSATVFARNFKKYYGSTPGQYRKNL